MRHSVDNRAECGLALQVGFLLLIHLLLQITAECASNVGVLCLVEMGDFEDEVLQSRLVRVQVHNILPGRCFFSTSLKLLIYVPVTTFSIPLR